MAAAGSAIVCDRLRLYGNSSLCDRLRSAICDPRSSAIVCDRLRSYGNQPLNWLGTVDVDKERFTILVINGNSTGNHYFTIQLGNGHTHKTLSTIT